MLELRNINKSFGDHQVLKNVSLDIGSKKTTVIIGSSGSGKSTLLRCINMLSRADSGILKYGDITLDFSKTLPKNAEETFRKKTGMVFQGFNLFPHKTVLDNISMAPIVVNKEDPASVKKRATELLEQVGLSDKAKAYPHELSGGQQQRVAIARTLAMKPDIILFDEPTSALDPEIELEILKLISDVTTGKYTNVIVTHNMNFAKNISDEVVFLEDGEVLAKGTYEELHDSANGRIRRFMNTLA